jgi:hypothetical protein
MFPDEIVTTVDSVPCLLVQSQVSNDKFITCLSLSVTFCSRNKFIAFDRKNKSDNYVRECENPEALQKQINFLIGTNWQGRKEQKINLGN